MFFNLIDSFQRLRFSLSCKKILLTEPIFATTENPVAVLSQLQHKDITLFLVSIKTFANRIPLNKVFIIDDGSLTPKDIALLKKHIPIAEFYNITQFSNPSYPNGRLLSIANFTNEFFVIQLDSDTLTMSDLDEVKQCISSNTAFILGTEDNQDFEPVSITSARAKNWTNIHVQVVSETHFVNLPNSENLRYVRGCAGFAGFPKGSLTKKSVIDFSETMKKLLPEGKWGEWGSDQVMTNFLISNFDKTVVLPHPKYTSPDKMKLPETCFIHFIGYCRFDGSFLKGSIYAEFAQQEIKKMKLTN